MWQVLLAGFCGMIDCHTHAYAPEMAADPRGFALLHREPHWAGLVAPVGKPSLQGWADPEQRLRAMDAAGIEKSVLLGWYWEHASACNLQQRFYEWMIRQWPDRFIAFTPLSFSDPLAMREQLRFAADHGFRGVGELHPPAQGVSWADGLLFEALAFANARRWPVNLHVTEPVGRPYEPRRETPAREVQHWVESFPDLRLILAHWGGLLCFHELNPYIRKTWTQVYYDTAASPRLYRPELIRLAIAAVGASKLLFGSDYPLKLYATGHPDRDLDRFARELMQGMDEAKDREAVMGGNFRRLMEGLSPDRC
jgi:predicted TIM-barrel fold metal-dependent hydrolase